MWLFILPNLRCLALREDIVWIFWCAYSPFHFCFLNLTPPPVRTCQLKYIFSNFSPESDIPNGFLSASPFPLLPSLVFFPRFLSGHLRNSCHNFHLVLLGNVYSCQTTFYNFYFSMPLSTQLRQQRFVLAGEPSQISLWWMVAGAADHAVRYFFISSKRRCLLINGLFNPWIMWVLFGMKHVQWIGQLKGLHVPVD